MAGRGRTASIFSILCMLWVKEGRLTLLLFRRHLSHAALTLVGSCRVAEVLDIDEAGHGCLQGALRLMLRPRQRLVNVTHTALGGAGQHAN